MAKAKSFSYAEICDNAKNIVKSQGVECTNTVKKPLFNENGVECGFSECIYDGLAVVCAVNKELFEQASREQKQVIAHTHLNLKPDSIFNYRKKDYRVLQVVEKGLSLVALIQAA